MDGRPIPDLQEDKKKKKEKTSFERASKLYCDLRKVLPDYFHLEC